MTRRVAALAVWAASWALALAAVGLRVAAGLPGEPLPGVFLAAAPDPIRAGFATIGVVVALVYGPVAALVISRRPHPVGIVLAVHAVGSGITAFGVQWGLLGAQVPGLPLWGLGAYAAGWGFVPGTFLTAVLPILVTSRRLSRAQRGLVALGVAAAALAFAAALVQDGRGVRQGAPALPRNPLAIPAVQPVLPPLYTSLTFVALALSVTSCVILLVRWRRAQGRRRTGLAWLGIGHVMLTVTYGILVIPEGVAVPRLVTDLGIVGPVLGQAIYPAALLVVVLGQRLWGVELVVDRIVLWVLLSLGGLAVYLVVVVVAGLLPGTAGGARDAWVFVPLAVALAVLPLRRWLQRRIDLLVYGEGADLAAVLARLGEQIGELEPGEAGLRSLCAALRRVLRLGHVGVRSAGSPLAASSGPPPRHPLVIPLRPSHPGGEPFGELVVSPPAGQRLDGRTIGVLTAVSGLVGAAVRLAEANAVLDAARTELLARRAAERRRIQRELHDGLGPALAGIGFGLAAVGNLLPHRPDEAGELLQELADDLGRRVRAVRSLAGEVSASPLDGASLRVAVSELAERFTTPALTVAPHIDAGDDLPQAVRDAAYLIVAEAMSNAARHAGATRVDVRVTRARDAVVVEVVDDGSGIAVEHRPGIGLVSMRERAAALGGRLRIDGSPSGTRIRADLPLAAPGPASEGPAARGRDAVAAGSGAAGQSALAGRDAGTGSVGEETPRARGAWNDEPETEDA
ncbi:sensor histidine kinase [Microbacterium sp. No. 7]|uniref:sensor histidine kinase n=1 Tax=Microbacterium sp. No. 7 TaxID=1714373 RepID=UPI0006D2127A|nr:ATP-binding protein [Microbacterium sp. No. 7]ALJ19221.1 hypothetical protein AOA12_04625 [Microbacterium sp. No. 7]